MPDEERVYLDEASDTQLWMQLFDVARQTVDAINEYTGGALTVEDWLRKRFESTLQVERWRDERRNKLRLAAPSSPTLGEPPAR